MTHKATRRRGSWLVIVATIPTLWACADGKPRAESSDTTSTTATTESTESTESTERAAAARDVDAWLDRLSGRTASYTATLRCPGPCSPGATWRITETDGDIVDARLDDTQPTRVGLAPMSLTEALRRAASATGNVTIDSTDTSIELRVDPVLDGIDDEFSYIAETIHISP